MQMKKLKKDCAVTIHLTAIEKKFLLMTKRQTGVSISDQIREQWLSRAAELFFGQRKKNSRNNQAAAASAPAVQ